tara:strand:+ start:119 stop:739 length:621 start_codon:yes stop_codon:yes gene_type:complete
MLIHCNHCKDKFTVDVNASTLEGKLVKCSKCNNEWIYITRFQNLENRINDLEKNLNKTETEIIEKKDRLMYKINSLEKKLKNRKEELTKQKILIDKISLFDKRLIHTEKINSEKADLEIRYSKIEKEIEKINDHTLLNNTEIEKKANYLEMKMSTLNDSYTKNTIEEKYTKKVELLNFKNFDQNGKNSNDEIYKDKKTKKYSFWEG